MIGGNLITYSTVVKDEETCTASNSQKIDGLSVKSAFCKSYYWQDGVDLSAKFILLSSSSVSLNSPPTLGNKRGLIGLQIFYQPRYT